LTDDLDAILGDMEAADLHALRAMWQARFGRPPTFRSPGLLRLMLAWRIQADACGGLDAGTRRALRRPTSGPGKPVLRSGTRMVREWKGIRYEAVVLDDGGYLYAGTRYDSLSHVARAITGTRWNGPRFFGLREREA
jgi:hypothetical protein